ncbi:MAG: hypothetical protein LBU32_14375 [Clostridiales bacterium]|jgi:hypothetical protein|nr:hypothetical protein [Clostridiales bacterium]
MGERLDLLEWLQKTCGLKECDPILLVHGDFKIGSFYSSHYFFYAQLSLCWAEHKQSNIDRLLNISCHDRERETGRADLQPA